MIKQVRPALNNSYEPLFHETGSPAFMVIFRESRAFTHELAGPGLGRAIGVIYRPGTERMSHYFEAGRPLQLDAVVHFDTTCAVVAIGGPEECAPHTEEGGGA